MDLNTITVADFKAFFYRDFAYLPVYNPAALYNSGSRVYYPVTLLFYDCQVDGTTGVTPGSNAAIWIKADDDTDNYVQDMDITKAFGEAQIVFNQGLFGSDTTIKAGYLYLTAHYLVNDLKAASGGIGASAMFPVSGRTVGSVSETYGIPAIYADDALVSFYSQSAYGMKYLSMILPQLVGNIGAVCGGTLPS